MYGLNPYLLELAQKRSKQADASAVAGSAQPPTPTGGATPLTVKPPKPVGQPLAPQAPPAITSSHPTAAPATGGMGQ